MKEKEQLASQDKIGASLLLETSLYIYCLQSIKENLGRLVCLTAGLFNPLTGWHDVVKVSINNSQQKGSWSESSGRDQKSQVNTFLDNYRLFTKFCLYLSLCICLLALSTHSLKAFFCVEDVFLLSTWVLSGYSSVLPPTKCMLYRLIGALSECVADCVSVWTL